MTKKSKQKGSSFERKLCKALSLWITHGERDDCLWRSAMSGGRATVAKAKGKLIHHQAGDVSSVHQDGHAFTDRWYVEAKHYRKLGIAAFLTARPSLLSRFWSRTVAEAEHYQRTPMLIAKENNVPTIVLIPDVELHLVWAKQSCLCISSVYGAAVLDFDAMLKNEFNL